MFVNGLFCVYFLLILIFWIIVGVECLKGNIVVYLIIKGFFDYGIFFKRLLLKKLLNLLDSDFYNVIIYIFIRYEWFFENFILFVELYLWNY